MVNANKDSSVKQRSKSDLFFVAVICFLATTWAMDKHKEEKAAEMCLKTWGSPVHHVTNDMLYCQTHPNHYQYTIRMEDL